MTVDQLKPNKVLRGPIFPEPVQVIVAIPMGDAVKLIAKGLNTSRVYEPILTPDKLATLETTPDTEPFDGDSQRFRLAIEAMRLALAYEYDPYFSLSIARVDPLPHQLEQDAAFLSVEVLEVKRLTDCSGHSFFSFLCFRHVQKQTRRSFPR